jgi:hypothetical protein
MTRRSILVDTAALVVLAAALIWPLFRLTYLDNWPSIESTFIADARMLGENLPHPGWQPQWYCGTRFDYIYPPALRYGTALISKWGGVPTARAYHVFTATFYVFGITAVYWLVRAGAKSRYAALLASAATALLSPCFLLLANLRNDSAYWVPQRLHVLMAYGEGPHISALSVLPAALAATWLALEKRRPAMLALAGGLCALTVACNFYGATSLAILFPIVTWSIWVGERNWRVWLRAAGIVALAFGLSAFWLTPSYIRITLVNLKWVSEPGNDWSRLTLLIVTALFCAITLKAGDRRPQHAWTIFVTGSAVMFSLLVLGLHYFGLRVLGEAHRLAPELDLALILAGGEVIRKLWVSPKWRMAAFVMTLLTFGFGLRYLKHPYFPFPKAGPLENRYEYQITKWVHDHLPGERVLPSGTVRFWYDAWFNNAQADGGSSQGMLNQILPVASWQVMQGDRGNLAVLWLQALGTDAVVVPDKTSPEWYHDYRVPEKFRGVAPVLYDDQHGTVVYRVPRRYSGIGRVVDKARILAAGPIRGGDDTENLSKYVAIVENEDQTETHVTWHGFDEAQVTAKPSAGQAVLLQETYDPAWRAYENGRRLAIDADPTMGFMLIDVPPGEHAIQMRFETPLENRTGQVLFGLTVLAMLGLVVGASVKRA